MSTLITNKQQREIVHQEYIFISSQVCGNRLLIHGKTSQFPPLLNCHEPVELIGYTCIRKLDNTVGSNAYNRIYEIPPFYQSINSHLICSLNAFPT